MKEIHLSDEVYKKAEAVAAAQGYSTVEEFVSKTIEIDAAEQDGNFDHLFTPEVIAGIRRGMADLEAGSSSTLEEVERRFALKREAWLKDRAS
jgi:predicted transcriptional regulator